MTDRCCGHHDDDHTADGACTVQVYDHTQGARRACHPAERPTANLDAARRRAAELQAALDAAPDEATARPVADELHALLDSLDNVRVLRTERDA